MNMMLLVIGVSVVTSLAVVGFLEKEQRMRIAHTRLGNLWLVWDNDRIPIYRSSTTFGRRKRRCDIALPERDSGISRLHGQIVHKTGFFFIYPAIKKDGSATEIYVNGTKVHPHSGAKIDRNSTIRISNTVLKVKQEEMPPPASQGKRLLPRMVFRYPLAAKILTAILCGLFMLLLCLKCLEVIPEQNHGMLIGTLVVNLLLLSGSCGYSWITKANIQSFSGAALILLSVGSSFQAFFPEFKGFVTELYLGVSLGIIAYFFWPYIKMKAWQYKAVFLAVLVLLIANMLFGKGDGARLWIGPLQPGEIIKTLLIPVLGAYCSTKRQKIWYCTACCVSCVVLLYLKDFGTVLILGGCFMIQLYLLYDNRLLSIGMIASTILALALLVGLFPHAVERIEIWGKAFSIPGGQQKKFIFASLLGGFGGLGDRYDIFTSIFAAETDALCGVQAILGVPVLCVTIGAYTLLAFTTGFNKSIRSSDFLLHTQVGSLITFHVLLSLLGALDVLPYSGVVSPLISDGGTSCVSFGIILGISAAVMNPKNIKNGERKWC